MSGLTIGTPVRTKASKDWLKGRYAGQKAFVEKCAGAEYSLLFETQGIAWYSRVEFDVLPPQSGDAEEFIRWLNRTR